MTHGVRMNSVVSLAGWLLLSFAAAGVGALASVRSAAFYAQLVQPSWAPPSWVFGPVWSILYLMQGIAAWLVWRERGFANARTALTLFVVQLALNALWTWLFFAWHRGALAFAEIIVLWLFIAITTTLFWRVRPIAGALLLPYLLWVSFASVLAYTMWQLNHDVLG